MEENRTHIVGVRLNEHEYQKLKWCAAQEHVKISEYLRSSIKRSEHETVLEGK